MKHFRIWLLVLLCMLLPLRGAMAAAMLCAPDRGGPPSAPMLDLGPAQAVQAHDGHAQETEHAHEGGDHAGHAGHAGHGEHGGHGGHGGHAGSDAGLALDKCNLCASFCSLTPTPVALAWPLAPVGPAMAPFPAAGTQVRSVVPAGLERPPRSI